MPSAEPQPAHVVLEVGTGSGYQSAVLARIVRHVYSVEIIESLGLMADRRLKQLEFTNISVHIGDGYEGWTIHGPFDGIMVTCGAETVPPTLIEQLKPGGRMIIPVGPYFDMQTLLLVEKDSVGHVTSNEKMPVRFVPMTGGHEIRS